MITINDVIKLEVTKEDIIECIKKTQSIMFIDNLRIRHPNVKFDCKLRGYIGELAIKKWFKKNNIHIERTNHIADGENIDIDFIVSGTNIELKTSLIPDNDIDIKGVIERRDIKLIRRNNQSIEELRGDIHMQIYYQQKTKAKDKWLEEQKNIDLTSKDAEYLYESLKAKCYLTTTFFVAWIDKEEIIKRINSLPENRRTWSFVNSKRDYWVCPLKDSNKPTDLINYFKSHIRQDNIIKLEPIIIPMYSIKAACGELTGGSEVAKVKDIQVDNLKENAENLFVVEAIGDSMQPLMNEGNLCVFKWASTSNEGDIVLVEQSEYPINDFGSYIIKKYTRNKDKIKLISLNKKREDANVTITKENSSAYRIIGVFVGQIISNQLVYKKDLPYV